MTDKKNPYEEMMKNLFPFTQVTPKASGYEIRTKILELAQTQAFHEFTLKSNALEISSKVEDGEVVQNVSFPNAEQVLNIAKSFNDFVSNIKKD